MSDFDLVIIGGGPGGYVCAIRAAQNGLKVACVEKRGSLGGTCLNVGCIPSKALLQSSHLFEEASHGMQAHGINTGKVSLDLAAMIGRKDGIVGDLTKGIEFLFKKNKVTYIKEAGEIVDANTVKAGSETLSTKNIVIATGSYSAPLGGVEVDEVQIVSSTGALALTKVPKTMTVIGGGVIGLELGSVWRRLGAEVTVIEYLDTIFPGMDAEVVKQATRTYKKQGLKFKMKTKVTGAKTAKNGVTLTVEPRDGGDPETLKADVVLLAVGRKPYTDGLGLDKAGITPSQHGFIEVDDHFRTSVDNIYAIGDVIGGPMLAHKAEEEGVAVADIAAGHVGHVNYDAIPGIVYTWPEVASVGQTEEKLKESGIAYTVGKFPFSANARARANGDTDGFVKILADATTDRLLGMHIIGPSAGELIQEGVLAMEFEGSAEDLARTCHGHPGVAEAVKEAALGVAGRSIHI